MKTIINKCQEIEITIELYFNIKNIALFDIETTGFNASSTNLYMIGCAFYDNEWQIIQWFNDDNSSELEIITSFFEFIKKYNLIINYNGDGFDIPYLIQKIKEYNLSFSFDNIISLDLYKKIRRFKDLLHLDNLKQKTLENFLGISRLDKYSGKDLIKVYNDYLATKNPKLEQILFQHNYEDLEGLLSCCTMLSYDKFKNGNFVVTGMSVKENKLCFSLSLENSIPKRITKHIDNILISAYKETATISIPIIHDTLKFYFDNYHEYYYLPAEDTAIHKSVASFVDKQYREKAKKENCYVKKEGYYITQLNTNTIQGYKYSHDTKESFIELVDSFLKNNETINLYAKNIIKLL